MLKWGGRPRCAQRPMPVRLQKEVPVEKRKRRLDETVRGARSTLGASIPHATDTGVPNLLELRQRNMLAGLPYASDAALRDRLARQL